MLAGAGVRESKRPAVTAGECDASAGRGMLSRRAGAAATPVLVVVLSCGRSWRFSCSGAWCSSGGGRPVMHFWRRARGAIVWADRGTSRPGGLRWSRPGGRALRAAGRGGLVRAGFLVRAACCLLCRRAALLHRQVRMLSCRREGGGAPRPRVACRPLCRRCVVPVARGWVLIRVEARDGRAEGCCLRLSLLPATVRLGRYVASGDAAVQPGARCRPCRFRHQSRETLRSDGVMTAAERCGSRTQERPGSVAERLSAPGGH